MAEKTLNTRIQLKYDTLANWNSSTFTLKKGELAIVEVPTNTPETLQPVMFKVGDGTKTFSQLDWASAKAADVYAWAKAAGITVTDNGTGKFVTGFTWTNNALVITRADVDWNDIQNKPDLALKSDLPTELGVMTVTSKDAIVATEGANVEISLKIDTTTPGNVTLSQGTNGLKATVDTGVHAVSLASGTNNGTLKLTVDGNTTDNIAVTGLGSAAYTEASAYDASGAAAQALTDAKQYTDDEIAKIPAQTDYTVTITETIDGLEDSIAKKYTFTQNGTEIGTINLAKELVVTAGSVKEVIEADQPYVGAIIGDKYIELVIANQSEPIYVPAKDLVDIYTARTLTAESTDEVQIAISNTNEISATLVDGKIAKTKLASDIQESLGLADSALQEITTTENGGLKVTNKNQIDIDTEIIFVLDCGTATSNSSSYTLEDNEAGGQTAILS